MGLAQSADTHRLDMDSLGRLHQRRDMATPVGPRSRRAVPAQRAPLAHPDGRQHRLEAIAEAFDDPEVGFVFSDWAEINEAGESCRYPDGWAFGYGSDYFDAEHGCWVMSSPNINATTARHIVSMPNHVRAWRASTYRAIGGHDPSLPVADDYDLCLRSVLHGKWAHIPRLLYRQHISASTAQRQRNDLIQSLVADIARRYDDDITERFGRAG